ncbi:MAG: NTP transferase domain-containing protein [Deltaproteobacteria bacterium]|nr:NTP transferase domain-containing protein [Deltaproteobacteria bacterium]
MGQPKGLMPYHGRPWLSEQLERIEALGSSDCYVVLGFERTAYLPLLETRFRATACIHSRLRTQLHVVHNPMPEHGPFSSLCAAIPRLPAATTAAFVLPLDVPAAQHATWFALATALTDDVSAVIPTHNGHGGHPVLLRRSFLEQLATIPRDAAHARLDHQLHALPSRALVRLAVSDAQVACDLNTPADLQQYSQAMDRSS